ncbi:MAG: DsbC family protein [Woeseiaceae bacterium]|jgi:thiol:disulfide interchange protein DsbC|nr:DsbC family protein [Woeseiaceae bacterium]
MRRQILSIIGITIAAAGCLGTTLAAADEQLEAVRAKIAEKFDAIDAEDIDTSGIDGWYKIQKGAIVAYVSADGRYLMQGDMIDLDNSINLTELARNSARRELMETLDDGEVIAFTPAEVKHTVTIFTDVECGYCRRLHSQIDDYLAQGIEVRYLLYPRNGPASRAWNTSEDVWCASDRPRALTAAKMDREFETRKCDASTVQQHYILGQEVGLTGTPAIVLEDGELIGGYLPADQLALRLDAKGN